ncbi:HAMP domain-containing sensor histidine kinase [Paractinoplanes ferrugineus]|uniref:histidine kinase n=1 Tax=Paractinoplanes ferrugineus TaxID=113564 RepID=A0A919J6A6_9ACTN|nr:HAMP domain-containing sensor histidine kinase [Actinoplanes ferrugineus]GIE14843.1 two-component sensor histidine kinase [Actinoplanes ferrugineus]
MADRRASVRLRTTAAAVLVVAAALVVGAVTLVLLMRDSLRDGLENTAEQRAAALAGVLRTGLPADEPAGDEDDPGLAWQVLDRGGTTVRSSGPRPDRPYAVVTEEAGDYTVAVSISLEEVDDSTAALMTPLLVGLPLMLLLVGGVTWVVSGRALAPVERIRREVEEITADRLDRRVPEPPPGDEIGRLARTMNRMLARLADSRASQQQFVADASHELRSPLASIRQAAEVTRDHPGALPEGELAETVLDEAARMQRLVEQLLLLTRPDGPAGAPPPRDVDLDDLALAEARRARRAGLRVDTSGIGPGRVRGDAATLGQVVRNLVDNAGRHAHATVAVTVRDTGGAVELLVDDDGSGVPAEQRERVFERFVRLDESRARDAGGSGLGLAIVRKIVTAHGGTVTITTSELGGARVQVRFSEAGAGCGHSDSVFEEGHQQ